MRRNNAKKPIKRIVLIVVVVLVIVASLAGYGVYREWTRETTDGEEISVTIPQGSTSKDIARILKDEGVVSSQLIFLLKLRNSGQASQLQYGDFTLNSGQSLADVIQVLTKSTVRQDTVTFTVPEGYSVQQIGVVLEEKGLCTAEEFKNAVNTEVFDYDFLNEVPNGVDYKLQGFLFPNTYEVYKTATPREIIQVMLEEFDKKWTDSHRTLADQLDLTVFETITLASLVEREAKLASERPTIAGVMFNRLDINMKLQIDATVQYVLSEGLFDVARIFYKDLEVDSAYNTYQNEGIPKGPICNPGMASIDGILNPEEHDYLYYVVEDEETGRHRFSKTYNEHQGQ